jgi:CheY-like chemotaxis protein
MTDKATILIIDNTKSNQAIFETYLEMQGFSVFFTETGSETLPAIRRIRPDILVLNVAAPARGALNILETVKNHPDLCDIPIMVLTVRQLPETVEKMLRTGSDAFLVKPFDVSDFLSKLLQLVRLAKDQNIVMLNTQKQKNRKKALAFTFKVSPKTDPDFQTQN